MVADPRIERAPAGHRGTWWAVLGYVLATCALTWPVVAHIGDVVAGEPPDLYLSFWDAFWVRHAIEERVNPLFTRHLFYPEGVSLAFHSTSWLSALLAVPLGAWLGPAAGYNFVVLLQTFGCALAMFLVARNLLGRTDAAWIAGLLFAFAPYRMAHATCHPNLAGTLFVPVAVWGTVRAASDDRARWAWVIAGALMLTVANGVHVFAVAAIALALIWFYAAIVSRRAAEPTFRRTTARIALASAALCGPWLLQYAGGDFGAAVDAAGVRRESNLLSFVTPSRFHPLLGRAFDGVRDGFDDGGKWSAYLGFAMLVLLWAAATRRPRAHGGLWFAAAAMFVFSLGGALGVGRTRLDLPMPWDLLVALPGVESLRSPDRFNLVLGALLALLAGAGLTRLTAQRAWVTALFTLAILFEYWSAPFPTIPAQRDPVYAALPRTRRDSAILELPMSRQRAKYSMFQQVFHGRPIVGGAIARVPKEAERFKRASPLLTALGRPAPRPFDCDKFSLKTEWARLYTAGVEHVVVRLRGYKARAHENVRGYLPGKPVYTGREALAFRTLDLAAAAPPCKASPRARKHRQRSR